MARQYIPYPIIIHNNHSRFIILALAMALLNYFVIIAIYSNFQLCLVQMYAITIAIDSHLRAPMHDIKYIPIAHHVYN
jgi:hypothetical protein